MQYLIVKYGIPIYCDSLHWTLISGLGNSISNRWLDYYCCCWLGCCWVGCCYSFGCCSFLMAFNNEVSTAFPSRKRINPSNSTTLRERLSKSVPVSGEFTISESFFWVNFLNPQHPLCIIPHGLTESTPKISEWTNIVYRNLTQK